MCSHMSITSQDSGDNSRSGRNGLTTWTHTLREEITSGRSDRDVTGVCAYRSSLQPTGMAASGRLRVSLIQPRKLLATIHAQVHVCNKTERTA